MMYRWRVLPLVAFLVSLLAGPTHADWMNLTGAETAPNIAEITVLDDRVRIALEVYVGDLEAFKALLPDDLLNKGAAARAPLAERLRRFSAETFQVVTGDGTKLPAGLKLAEPRLRKERRSPFAGMINPVTRQRVPDAPKDKRVLYAEIEYPFDGKPESLTFIPPRDEKGLATVTIGFIAYHKAVPIIDFRYLSGPATVTLDWSDPWYTKFDNPNLKRHHKSALMSFLYVEPREVRHEILVRIRDLQDWADLGLSGSGTISVDEQKRIKELARTFLATRNPLKIDGVSVKPESGRSAFIRIALNGLQVIEEEKPLDLSTAIIGVILSYPVKNLPKQVTVTWDLFSDRIERIPATAIDPVGPLLSFVEAGDPTFEWENFLLQYKEPKVTPVIMSDGHSLGIPVMSVLLAALALGAAALAFRPRLFPRPAWMIASGLGAIAAVLLIRVAVVEVRIPFSGPPDEKISTRIVESVLSNVNHAYLERDPAVIRKQLEHVVFSAALDDVHAELGRALAIKVAGGGIARVRAIKDLTLKDISALKGHSGFRSLAEWTAKASAGHWGHAHRRTIRFRALVEIVEDSGAWKLAGITVVDAKQQS